MEKLTRRERECLELAAQGETNEQIAARLCLERNTVRQHLKNAYQCLHLEDIGNPRTVAAVMWAREQKEEGR